MSQTFTYFVHLWWFIFMKFPMPFNAIDFSNCFVVRLQKTLQQQFYYFYTVILHVSFTLHYTDGSQGSEWRQLLPVLVSRVNIWRAADRVRRCGCPRRPGYRQEVPLGFRNGWHAPCIMVVHRVIVGARLGWGPDFSDALRSKHSDCVTLRWDLPLGYQSWGITFQDLHPWCHDRSTLGRRKAQSTITSVLRT